MKDIGSTVGQDEVWPARASGCKESVKVRSKEVNAFSCVKGVKLSAEVVGGCVEKCCVTCVKISKEKCGCVGVIEKGVEISVR